MKKIIITTADCFYFDVLKAFLASMRYNGNNCFIRVDFINSTKKMRKELKHVYPNLEINLIKIGGYENMEAFERRLQLTWTRLPQAWKALNERWDIVCIMDCDVLIRGNLVGMWKNVTPDVFKVFTKKETDKKGQIKAKATYQGGVQIFGNSQNIKKFYKDVMKYAGKRFFPITKAQKALYIVSLEHKQSIRIVDLGKQYNDDRKKKDPSSIVWHIKHKKIKEKNAFTYELEEYQKIANDYIREKHVS